MLKDYKTNLCGGGRGQGIATFSKESFTIDGYRERENINMIKMKHALFNIIGVYTSQNANPSNIIENLAPMIEITRPTVIVGDFNICLRRNKNNPVTTFLTTAGFKQLVKEATHIEVIEIFLIKG